MPGEDREGVLSGPTAETQRISKPFNLAPFVFSGPLGVLGV